MGEFFSAHLVEIGVSDFLLKISVQLLDDIFDLGDGF
jgi:hypothetical protein